ncbi:peptidoglycan DD-metalloendopeptidase family protein [Streptomyces sp. GSL17-111]|uniref:peptidoglycan DD-metalloendopeptidase family protein n=1 Tax=Streptomyces sp. GSL17-111 TaxID=3121596 RepID=UPI0030F3A0C7
MNDRPPSGLTTPAGSGFSGYAGYEDPYGQAAAHGYAVTDADHGYTGSGYGDDDPLFGALPDDGPHAAQGGADAQPAATGYDGFPTQQVSFTASPFTAPGHDPSSYASSHDGASYGNPTYDGSAYGDAGYGMTEYGTGTYGAGVDAVADVTALHPSDHDNNAFSQAAGYETGGFSTDPYGAGTAYDPLTAETWTAEAWPAVDNPLSAIPAQPDHGWADSTEVWDTGAHAVDAPQGHDVPEGPPADAHAHAHAHEEPYGTDLADHPEAPDRAEDDTRDDLPPVADADDTWAEPEDAATTPTSAPPSAGTVPAARGGRRRRAAKPKRSALLTVAVPSVAVMGVAGIAAASVGGGVAESAEDSPAQAAPDQDTVKPAAVNNKLDTQLAGLSADVRDFGDRASRTQERIDLKARQEAERERKAAEAAKREAMRPKFALPVDQRGLSAYYGQAGINWMSVHTGIDFPVGYGTPVKAATDGTVTTRWDIAYGNMMVVTAADGTETWYCHLSSTRIRSGQVKAGDTIGYAGSSGNSTGPHLHFEVRPGGGSAVDPVAWFRGKGLDPT